MIAFTLMTAGSRASFRSTLGVDDATWLRGRGWAMATIGCDDEARYGALVFRLVPRGKKR